MAIQRLLEIDQRADNGQLRKLLPTPYALNQQPLVRIGSASPPRGDLVIPNVQQKEVEPLHLLLRLRKDASTYEVLNVSAQPVTVFHPTAQGNQPIQRLLAPNDGAEPLADSDSVEFGGTANSGYDKYQLTYQSGEWVTLELEIQKLPVQPNPPPQYKLTFSKGDLAQARLTLRRCPDSPHIPADAAWQFATELIGLEPSDFEWSVKRTNTFSGQWGGEAEYKLTCTADCRAPGKTVRVRFVATLLSNTAERLHTVARSAIFELVPCGPFELEFEQPPSA